MGVRRRPGPGAQVTPRPGCSCAGGARDLDVEEPTEQPVGVSLRPASHDGLGHGGTVAASHGLAEVHNRALRPPPWRHGANRRGVPAACGAVPAGTVRAELRPVGLARLGQRRSASSRSTPPAGPSWKPLPVRSRRCSPRSRRWTIGSRRRSGSGVARAGGLFALLMAFRVAGAARRRTPGRRRAVAGSVALVALALTPEWVRYMIHGNEAPLAVGLVLLAVDRHLDGHRQRPPFVAGPLACLARPELFGFLLLYGAYLVLRSPARRRARARDAGGHRSPPGCCRRGGARGIRCLRLSTRLAASPPGACRCARSRGGRRSTWRRARPGSCSSWRHWRPRRSRGGAARAPPAPAAAGAAGRAGDPRGGAALNVALYAAMTEAGFSGNARYVLTATALVAVLGGVGAALLVQLGPGGRPSGGARRAAALAGRGAGPELATHVGRGALRGPRLDRALRPAPGARARGGPGRARLRGALRAGDGEPLLPDAHGVGAVHADRGRLGGRGPRRSRSSLRISPWPARPDHPARRGKRLTIARVGEWTVAERPPAPRHVYTWPVQGFSLRVAAAA